MLSVYCNHDSQVNLRKVPSAFAFYLLFAKYHQNVCITALLRCKGYDGLPNSALLRCKGYDGQPNSAFHRCRGCNGHMIGTYWGGCEAKWQNKPLAYTEV